nr:mucoidy inhibitor MuiA family protein [uncultured Psychroserpens sp.]
MKQFTLLLFLITAISFANTKKGTATTLEDVTVYLSGAQIKRTASIKIPIGTTEFVFNKLSPNIQESSIQVSGLKNASILSINYGINYLSKQDTSQDVEVIQEQIAHLQDQIQAERHLISGYEEESYLITQNRALGNTSEVVSLEKLQKFASYYRTRITEIRTLTYQANKAITSFNAEISDLQKQLREFNVDEKVQTGEIKIKLNTDIATDLTLNIKYNVSNAGWFPIYDIKAEKINAPIQLAYKAHVYQNTGNDWDNIKLTLSTSDPSTNNVKPDINPKYLNFTTTYNNYKNNRATKRYHYKYNPLVKTVSGVVTSSSDGLPLPGVSVIEKGTNNGTQTDFDGRYSLQVNGGQELTFSYVGSKSENISIHSSIMNVALTEDVTALSEVAITSQGTRRRPNASFAQTLEGQVAGLNIARGNSSINLRGVSSLSGYKEALFVIDGEPINEGDFRGLDPDMIASMQVLKDTEATAIYGNRGRNGVVLIETKKENFTSNGDLIEEGITNTRFEIKKAYSIPNNGDVTVIEIENFTVPASYAYFAAPVLNENVFLTAKIDDWEQYNLLPAEANVYFEGSYSGKTNINPQSTTEELTISLGVDPNVVVKRTQPRDFKKNAFIGSNRIISKHYEIELKNNKSSAIDLVLYDRIPISQNKDIKIDNIETGTSEYDDKKGILKWKLNLPANDKDVHKFSYTVKYPKYKRVNL